MHGDQKALGFFCDFLKVSLSTILYLRQVYPAAAFEKTLFLSIPVMSPISETLKRYIDLVVEAVAEDINSLERVILVVATLRGKVCLERFVFEVLATSSKELMAKPARSLQLAIRECLVRINFCDSMLSPLPIEEELTFYIAVKTRDDSAQPKESPLPFLWQSSPSQLSCSQALLIPLKGCSSLDSAIRFRLYAEESQTKVSILQEPEQKAKKLCFS